MKFWGQRLVTAGDQGKIFCYDSGNGELTSDYRFSDKFVTSISVNGKNDVMFANSNGEVGLFREGTVCTFPTEHMKYIRSSSFLHDYNKVVLASDDLRISVFDMYFREANSRHQGKSGQVLSGHLNLINCVDCHPSEPIICTA